MYINTHIGSSVRRTTDIPQHTPQLAGQTRTATLQPPLTSTIIAYNPFRTSEPIHHVFIASNTHTHKQNPCKRTGIISGFRNRHDAFPPSSSSLATSTLRSAPPATTALSVITNIRTITHETAQSLWNMLWNMERNTMPHKWPTSKINAPHYTPHHPDQHFPPVSREAANEFASRQIRPAPPNAAECRRVASQQPPHRHRAEPDAAV